MVELTFKKLKEKLSYSFESSFIKPFQSSILNIYTSFDLGQTVCSMTKMKQKWMSKILHDKHLIYSKFVWCYNLKIMFRYSV